MTDKGKALIREFEGCSLVAYKCPAGVWTIGYGSTYYADGSKVKEGDKIDIATANRLFDMVLSKFEAQVKGTLGNLATTLAKESVDALVSFAYNCGVSSLSRSTLLKVIKANKLNLSEIKKQFLRWNKAGGKELKGLTRRREAEFELYLEGICSQYTKRELIKNIAGV